MAMLEILAPPWPEFRGYRLVARLPAGATGQGYAAVFPGGGDLVAVKVLGAGAADVEADVLRRVNGPFLGRLVDTGVDERVRSGRRRLHRLPRRLVPSETRADLGDRQTHRRHDRVRGAAQALGGRAHVRVADAFAPTGPGLRDSAGQQRGDDPVVDGHTDGPASGTATGRRTTLNAPDVSCRSHPRSARRRAFERTPSTFAGVVSKPSRTVISLAFNGP